MNYSINVTKETRTCMEKIKVSRDGGMIENTIRYNTTKIRVVALLSKQHTVYTELHLV